MRTLILFLIMFHTSFTYVMDNKEPKALPDSFYWQKSKKFIFNSNLITISSRIKAIRYLKQIIRKCDNASQNNKQQKKLLQLLDPGYIWVKNKPLNKESHDYFRFQFAELAYRFLMFHVRYQLDCYFGQLTREEKPFNLKKISKKEFSALIEKKYPNHEAYIAIQIDEAKKLANELIYFVEYITPKC